MFGNMAEQLQDQLYYILGMNFLEEYKGELILEDIWGTPGADGKGEWKKRITSAEFKRVKEPGLEEMTVYASYEEFVLVCEFSYLNDLRLQISIFFH